jgi:hypothetical protein
MPRITEAQLQRDIIELCSWHHLLVYHTHDSRRSRRGFPDLVIVGPRGVLFRELKSETGKMEPDQTCWGQGLAESGANWAVWRPGDWHSGRIRAEVLALTARVRP